MDVEAVITEGVGNSSYMLVSEGEAVLVDPQRDAWRFLPLLEAHGARLRAIVETHVHNDYVSGGIEARAATGAELCLPAGGGYEFDHRPLAEGDELPVGAVRLVVWATPGHTPEHLSYVAFEDETPVAAFTGGSLMVGAAGRTDLLGPEMTGELTRAQYASVTRLGALPSSVRVLPTHGAGSFCSAGAPGGGRTSSVGAERATNPALRAPDLEAFIQERLSNLLEYPAYYSHMAAANRRGPEVLGAAPRPGPLSAEELHDLMSAGVPVIDGRGRLEFAAGHVPGSLNIERDDSFATYTGWTVPFGSPVALILPEAGAAAASEAAVELARIGYDRVRGYLDGGFDSWAESGRPVSSYPSGTLEELCRRHRSGSEPLVLDVRQPAERAEGAFPGSVGIFVGDLPGRERELPREREIWTVCASGHRASIAASLLDRAGLHPRLVAGGGVADLLRICRPETAGAGAGR